MEQPVRVPRKEYPKVAQTDYPINPLIKERWSPCIFSSDPVEKEKIHSLFEAARWAPSSFGEQPWSFVLGFKDEGEAHNKLLSALWTGNQDWAKFAPILGYSVTHMTFRKNGKPNPHARHDVGLAMGTLLLQATELGLSVHQMAGFYPDKVVAACRIPDGWEPVAAFAIGYMGDREGASPALLQRDESARGRFVQRDFLFWNEFGESWPGL